MQPSPTGVSVPDHEQLHGTQYTSVIANTGALSGSLFPQPNEAVIRHDWRAINRKTHIFVCFPKHGSWDSYFLNAQNIQKVCACFGIELKNLAVVRSFQSASSASTVSMRTVAQLGLLFKSCLHYLFSFRSCFNRTHISVVSALVLFRLFKKPRCLIAFYKYRNSSPSIITIFVLFFII